MNSKRFHIAFLLQFLVRMVHARSVKEFILHLANEQLYATKERVAVEMSPSESMLYPTIVSTHQPTSLRTLNPTPYSSSDPSLNPINSTTNYPSSVPSNGPSHSHTNHPSLVLSLEPNQSKNSPNPSTETFTEGKRGGRGYFNYNPSDLQYGPEQWMEVENSIEGEYWESFKDILGIDDDTNECDWDGRQSPIDLCPNKVNYACEGMIATLLLYLKINNK